VYKYIKNGAFYLTVEKRGIVGFVTTKRQVFLITYS